MRQTATVRANLTKEEVKMKRISHQLPESHEVAHIILGDDYITPEETMEAYGFSYTGKQLRHFADTLPDLQTILWLRANRYMLCAELPTEMNLLEIKGLDDKLFYSKIEKYAEYGHKFSSDDKVNAGEWLAIRKGAVPNSFSKTWREQQNLLTEVEYVPNITEVSYAVTAYCKIRGVFLLQSYYVRTSSIVYGRHIHAGRFDADGLIVHFWNDQSHIDFGISSALKLPL